MEENNTFRCSSVEFLESLKIYFVMVVEDGDLRLFKDKGRETTEENWRSTLDDLKERIDSCTHSGAINIHKSIFNVIEEKRGCG